MTEEKRNEELSEEVTEEEIMKLAAAMKDNVPAQEERQNVHSFLNNVIDAEDVDKVSKLGNLRDDKEINELGIPRFNVRGALGMARISERLMGNPFFKEYYEAHAVTTLGTSLSRDGFIIKMATTTTKQVADATRRRKINKGMFGKKTVEESGGDINQQAKTE